MMSKPVRFAITAKNIYVAKKVMQKYLLIINSVTPVVGIVWWLFWGYSISTYA